MFMSFPAVNHVQYRLTADGDGTRLKFTHRAMGPIPDEVREGVGTGMGLRPQADRRDRGAAGGRAAEGGELKSCNRFAQEGRRTTIRYVRQSSRSLRSDPAEPASAAREESKMNGKGTAKPDLRQSGSRFRPIILVLACLAS